MRCCLLSRSEAIRLERDQVVPSCTEHIHISFPDALSKVDSDEYRWVTSYEDSTRRRITQASIILYWSTRPCVIRKGKQIEGVIHSMQATSR